MGRSFDVVGDDLDGDGVMGEIMGNEILGAAVRRRMRIPPKPHWRAQLAPGVIQPDEGLVPLTLAAQAGGGTFTAALPVITLPLHW